MDISHHKFTNTTTTTWSEPYISSSMEENLLLHHDHTHHQWPYNLLPVLQTSNEPPSNLLVDVDLQTGRNSCFKGDEGDRPQEENDHEEEDLGAMKEMMFKIAAMQPVDIDPATIRKPRRRNVRISDDPQSVAARHRRERISEKIRILQRLVPGGTKMDTASMLDEAIRYVKFLKRQIRILQGNHHHQPSSLGIPTTATTPTTPTEDRWLGQTSSFVFRGNNNVHEGLSGDDDVMCLNHKYICD